MDSKADEVSVLYVADETADRERIARAIEQLEHRYRVTPIQPTPGTLEGVSEEVQYVIIDEESCGIPQETIRDGVPGDPCVLSCRRGANGTLRVVDHTVSGRTDAEFVRTVQQVATPPPDLLALLDQTSNDVVWMFNADWSELCFVNAAVEDVFGLSRRTIVDDPTSFLEAIHPDDRAKTRAAMERLSAGESVELEYRLNPAENFERWGWVKGESLLDANGNVERIMGFTRDITERKYRERKLERYRTVVEASGDPMYMLNVNGNFTFVNEAMSKLTGHPRDQLVGENAEIIFQDGEYERGSTIIRHLLSNEDRQAKYESALCTAGGETVPCENQLSILYDETDERGSNFRGTVGVIRDISRRKGRERRLTTLHEVSQELMEATSRQEVTTIAVHAVQEMLGLEANTVHLKQPDGLVPVAMTDSVSDLIGEPPTFAGGDSIAWRAYEAGEARAIDNVTEDPDVYNPETPVRSELYLPLDDHGILIAGSRESDAFEPAEVTFGELLAGKIVAVLDRVEREERLREREQELVRQNNRLDEFASIVSHDLRNPLTIASGRLELAAEECESEHLDAMEQALDRMESLIDELLVFTRMGESATDLERVSVLALVRECWKQVETGSAVLVSDTDLEIFADRMRLRRLFENLFRNAVEHCGESVTVTVRPTDSGFAVIDDGPGIPAEKREDIFERGFTTRTEGTGFGLPIVEEIAEAHGWEVRVFEPASGGAGFGFDSVQVVD